MTGDLTDLLVGHSTHDSFTAMTRIYKHYDFSSLADDAITARRVSFSSYPGAGGRLLLAEHAPGALCILLSAGAAGRAHMPGSTVSFKPLEPPLVRSTLATAWLED